MILTIVSFSILMLLIYWFFYTKALRYNQRLLKIEKEKAENANIEKSHFLANMSHELRTPMHGIISYANMGISKFDKVNDEKKLHFFKNIKISADRLMPLLNSLLDLSKLESGKLEMNFSLNSLKEITHQCILEQKARLDELKLIVPCIENCTCTDLIIKCDPEKMTLVITNLLSNAIKHSSANQTIEMTIKISEITTSQGKTKPALLYSVRDSGEGIPESELNKIFDKFEQGSNAKVGLMRGTGLGSNAKVGLMRGTGLGLSISKEIIKLHHGKIWAENHPDGGAVFQFIIPVEQPINKKS